MGYAEAGFEVTGVDLEHQPNYPFAFHQADALTFPLDGYDVIHASPPCQHYAAVTRWRGDHTQHPDLVQEVRARLAASGTRWVMENVRGGPKRGSPLRADFVLCGSMFGLRIRRHRHFEVPSLRWALIPPCSHRKGDLMFGHKGERAYADAMGCGWMGAHEGREAIPPAYTRWIGEQLLNGGRASSEQVDRGAAIVSGLHE